MTSGGILHLVASGGSDKIPSPRDPYNDDFVECKGIMYAFQADFLVAFAVQFVGVEKPVTLRYVRLQAVRDHPYVSTVTVPITLRPVKFPDGVVHVCIFREAIRTNGLMINKESIPECTRSFAIVRYVDTKHRSDRSPVSVHIPKPLSVTHTHKTPRPTGYFTDIAWESHKTRIDAHGVTILSFRDRLSSDVLQFMCGGRKVLHTGFVALNRFDNYKISGPLHSAL